MDGDRLLVFGVGAGLMVFGILFAGHRSRELLPTLCMKALFVFVGAVLLASSLSYDSAPAINQQAGGRDE